MKAAIYLRVSTARQAEKDVSIPDQLKTVEEFCRRCELDVVAVYTESGRSARDDNRPEFKRMIDDALSADHPFEMIVVHSFSRFYRDEVHQEIYLRKLEESGVVMQSATEEVGQGFAGEMSRRILSLVAEMENKQRAARVSQTMLENARQGFFNGSHPPYGYRAVEAERRGDTVKKRLDIDPAEAEIVRMIYRLCLHGDGSGPMGIKGIVSTLNAKGLTYRRGRPFRINEVHRILRRSTCMGIHYYNRRIGKTDRLRDPSEWIPIEVPHIIEPDTFEAVQRHLQSRRPAVKAARLSNGSMLLTQIATCPHCGSGMTLRTGKSGRYRYYTCAGAASKGKASCAGRSIPMAELDEVVLGALESRLLQPERLKEILAGVAEKILQERSKSVEKQSALQRERRQVEQSINRLYEAIEQGLVGDGELFRKRLSGHKLRFDEITRLMAYDKRQTELPADLLSPKNIDRFATAMRRRIRDPERDGLRKAYVRMLVSRVVVGEKRIEIHGSNAALMAAALSPASHSAGEVPSSMPEWRRERDSNPRYGYPHTRFPSVRLQPLGHPSAAADNAEAGRMTQAFAAPNFSSARWLFPARSRGLFPRFRACVTLPQRQGRHENRTHHRPGSARAVADPDRPRGA